MVIPKAFFSKGMGAFCRKSGGRVVVASSPHISLPPVSSFRVQREISLAQRSNGERQMRSSRSTHAILSLPHKYRVPLRRKRSLGSARDDDTRERFPHIPFHTSASPTSAPSGHLLPWEGGRMPLPHEEDLRYENTAFPVSSFRAKREIFLAQRSNGERQMRSSRSTHAILSLPHKYRVPLRRKRSLDYARDDDMRGGLSHMDFHPTM